MEITRKSEIMLHWVSGKKTGVGKYARISAKKILKTSENLSIVNIQYTTTDYGHTMAKSLIH